MTIKTIAVLGAGVMGVQIAAHFVNAGLKVILFDLPSSKEKPNALVEKAIASLRKMKPLPVGMKDYAQHITAANYEEDLAALKKCALVIEAISERMDWKQMLFQKVVPFLAKDAVLATNSSGLSIETMASSLPTGVRSRFCGVHFFNPPRYMKLVELIPHSGTDVAVLDKLETFLVRDLGKGIVRAKDTPNFVANRIGLFAFLSALAHAQELNLSPEVVDALSGPLVGRPKSATFRTMDVVGLDVMQHVVGTMQEGLPNDPWLTHFVLPPWIDRLVAKGALGQKTRAGVYKKMGKNVLVFDSATLEYRPQKETVDKELLAHLKAMPAQDRLQYCRSSSNPQAQFIWRSARDLFHYCAYHLDDTADNVRDIDCAIRWGFAWQQGPFEMWQMSGWSQISSWIKEDSAAEKTLAHVPLPSWVSEVSAVYREGGAYSPAKRMTVPRSNLAVYKRHLSPSPLLAEKGDNGKTIQESGGTRLWSMGDDIAILSFKTSRNCISQEVLDGICQALEYASANSRGLVLYPGHGGDFSVGADLKQAMQVLKVQAYDLFEKAVAQFQWTAQALRFSSVPVVAAIKGLVLGGGCELTMHCSATVAAFETYMGLVETGVGLIPAGGGTKELARRIAKAKSAPESFSMLERYFKQVAMAEISSSAYDAIEKGYLRESDTILMNEEDLLFSAMARVKAMSNGGYRTLQASAYPVLGKAGKAVLETLLLNMREGHLITEHDYKVSHHLAHVLCGGDVDKGSHVDDTWMLRLEREAFVALGQMDKTVDRIQYTLENGKPLRN